MDELEEFREQWLREVQSKPKAQTEELVGSELEAREIFLRASKFEFEKNYEEAIKYYKQAMKLDPEVDIKYNKGFRKANQNKPPTKTTKDVQVDEQPDTVVEIDTLEAEVDEPRPVQNSPFLDLPDDVLVLILSFAIAGDVSSTLPLSLLCTKMQALVKTASIWKYLCSVYQFHETEESLKEKLHHYNFSWLDMFQQKPRLRLDGIYIALLRYTRTGWSETLTYLQPVHVVTYYRYLRFISDSTFLFLTTPVEPAEVVKKVYPDSKLEGLIVGQYSWESDSSVRLEWSVFGKNITYFCAILKITSKNYGRHDKLLWNSFNSVNSTGSSIYTYPKKQQAPFIFSKVLSY